MRCDRQGRQRATRAARRRSDKLVATLYKRSARRVDARTTKPGGVRNPPRRTDDAPSILAKHKTLRKNRRHHHATLAAHFTPRLRNALTKPRRRLTQRANVTRTFKSINDANLYACSKRASEIITSPTSSARVAPLAVIPFRRHPRTIYFVHAQRATPRVARHPRTIYFLHAQAWLENNRIRGSLPVWRSLPEIPESVARCHAKAWTCNAVRE